MQFVPKPRLLIQFTVFAITRECAVRYIPIHQGCVSPQRMNWVAWHLKLLVGHGEDVLCDSSGNWERRVCSPHPKSHWHANHLRKLILSARPVLFPCLSISLLFPSLPNTAPSFIYLCLHLFNISWGSAILCKVLGRSSKESRCISCPLGTVNLVFDISKILVQL